MRDQQVFPFRSRVLNCEMPHTPKRKAKPSVATNPTLLRQLEKACGSKSKDWNLSLGYQVSCALPVENDKAAQGYQARAVLPGMASMRPRNELEGMMAAQLIAAHHAAMDCFRRAAYPGQTLEGRSENLSQANKLSRSFAMMVEALDHHRGKGQQKVTVKHVHVHAGGQAMVGNVRTPGGGGRQKIEEQPHAKQIAHASEPEMRSTHQVEAQALPSRPQWQTDAVECTAAPHQDRPRVARTPSNTAATPQRRLRPAVRSPHCFGE